MSGYVYCFSNPAMPGLVKVGFTEAPIEQRLEDANSSTWVPAPFVPEFARYVKDPRSKEQVLHKIFQAQRVSPKREFFRVDPELLKLHFELMDGAWWSPDIEEPDEKILGDEVIRMFLDTHVFPSSNASAPVQWAEIAAAFQIWKKREGYKHGATMKLREALTEAYGQPARGQGWSSIRLLTQEPTEYCDDDRAYIRPSAK
jgi:hypothetical protein